MMNETKHSACNIFALEKPGSSFNFLLQFQLHTKNSNLLHFYHCRSSLKFQNIITKGVAALKEVIILVVMILYRL